MAGWFGNSATNPVKQLSGIARERPSTHRLRIPGVGFAMMLLAACASATPAQPATAIIPDATTTASPTFLFPTLAPTPSFTPRPQPSSTPDSLAEVGDLVFQDTFDSNLGWELVESANGATSIQEQRLVLAVRSPQSFRYAILPVDPGSGYYVEVQVRADICQPETEFGLLFHLQPDLGHYRFALRCDGTTRVALVNQGGSRALILPTQSNAAYQGPLVENNLALLIRDDRFRFWINGQEQFSAQDPALADGSLGLFAQTGAEEQLTVSFDDLKLYALIDSPTPVP